VRLEAAYQHAFTAIETLVAAIERVHQLRSQQRAWAQATKLGVAVKRPEPGTCAPPVTTSCDSTTSASPTPSTAAGEGRSHRLAVPDQTTAPHASPRRRRARLLRLNRGLCRTSAKVRQPRTADMDADDLYFAVWPDGQPVSTITSNEPM
jgi:hypothetical protein